jgi:hypothetical protein
MIMRLIDRIFGIKIDTITPEEAARIMLEKEVTFKWQPQIVEMKPDAPTPTSVVTATGV